MFQSIRFLSTDFPSGWLHGTEFEKLGKRRVMVNQQTSVDRNEIVVDLKCVTCGGCEVAFPPDDVDNGDRGILRMTTVPNPGGIFAERLINERVSAMKGFELFKQLWICVRE